MLPLECPRVGREGDATLADVEAEMPRAGVIGPPGELQQRAAVASPMRQVEIDAARADGMAGIGHPQHRALGELRAPVLAVQADAVDAAADARLKLAQVAVLAARPLRVVQGLGLEVETLRADEVSHAGPFVRGMP